MQLHQHAKCGIYLFERNRILSRFSKSNCKTEYLNLKSTNQINQMATSLTCKFIISKRTNYHLNL